MIETAWHVLGYILAVAFVLFLVACGVIGFGLNEAAKKEGAEAVNPEPWECPTCGAIHLCSAAMLAQRTDMEMAQSVAQLDETTGATSDGLRQIAQEVLASKAVTKDGRRAYNQGYTPGFQALWSVYPLHRDKRKAFKAWRNALNRATQTQILDGAIRYRDDPNRVAQFTKYAEGWLNGDGWLDDPLPPRNTDSSHWLDQMYRDATGGGKMKREIAVRLAGELTGAYPGRGITQLTVAEYVGEFLPETEAEVNLAIGDLVLAFPDRAPTLGQVREAIRIRRAPKLTDPELPVYRAGAYLGPIDVSHGLRHLFRYWDTGDAVEFERAKYPRDCTCGNVGHTGLAPSEIREVAP